MEPCRMTCYSGFVDKNARHIPLSGADHAPAQSFAELAARQGVVPVEDFEALLGKPSPEDEPVEEFAVRLRELRREGTDAGTRG